MGEEKAGVRTPAGDKDVKKSRREQACGHCSDARGRIANRRTSHPPRPAMSEDERMPSFEISSRRLLPKASVATNRDIVNPIPPTQAAP